MEFVFPEWDSLSLNDICQVAHTKSTGQCKFIEDCPSVEREIWKQGLFPQLCGFFNSTKEMICCPKKRISQRSSYEMSGLFVFHRKFVYYVFRFN